MRVVDLKTRIAPFDDPVGELPLFFGTFRQRQRHEVGRCGVASDRITLADHALASGAALRRFAQAAPKGRVGALALPDRPPWSSLAPVSTMRKDRGLLIFDIFMDAPEDADLEALRDMSEPVPIEAPAEVIRRELPRLGAPPHHINLPNGEVIAGHVEHWVHVLWLWPALLPALRAEHPGHRRRRHRAPRPSYLGNNVQVHPTAYLEGSVIGEGVEIGAHCSVRNSFIGPGSRLSDFTKVSRSCFGAATHTLADSCFTDVVAFGGGTLANLLIKDTVLGRGVFLTSGVIFWGEPLDGTVRVDHQGELVDTGRKALGGCAGHGSILGARTIVAPGRTLPNRTNVVMRPEEGVMTIEDAPPGTPMCWYDAALVPVERLRVTGAPVVD